MLMQPTRFPMCGSLATAARPTLPATLPSEGLEARRWGCVLHATAAHTQHTHDYVEVNHGHDARLLQSDAVRKTRTGSAAGLMCSCECPRQHSVADGMPVSPVLAHLELKQYLCSHTVSVLKPASLAAAWGQARWRLQWNQQGGDACWLCRACW